MKTDIMVVGGGGREHAVIKALRKSPEVGKIYALPGNGGIAADAECVPIKATDIPALVGFAVSHGVGYAVVTPDDPLVLGAVDALEAAGVPCFGPRANAAIIEGSKAFSKQLMKKYGIPTAAYEIFTDREAALAYLETVSFPHRYQGGRACTGQRRHHRGNPVRGTGGSQCHDAGGAFGKSGERIVIEQYLTGPEVSVLSFTDGKTIVPMVSSMDHKRALDGDRGLNTGGMGTVAPQPVLYRSDCRHLHGNHFQADGLRHECGGTHLQRGACISD